MVLGCVNRTVWGTRLLLTAVWASLVDCISSWHLLKAQHCPLNQKTASTCAGIVAHVSSASAAIESVSITEKIVDKNKIESIFVGS